MKILLYDKMQYATGVPAQIITPALSDKYITDDEFTVTYDTPETVDCIGIGYTDATQVTISDGSDSVIITLPYTLSNQITYNNGLYLLGATFYSDTYTISHNGNYIGRVAIGKYRTLGTNPTKELGFYTTNESRQTMSGQVIPGAGGYSGRRCELDVRYKIDEDIYNDMLSAYNGQISKNYPFFLLLDDEQHKFPASIQHFYGRSKDVGLLLQSSTYKFLYSYKFSFYEAF